MRVYVFRYISVSFSPNFYIQRECLLQFFYQQWMSFTKHKAKGVLYQIWKASYQIPHSLHHTIILTLHLPIHISTNSLKVLFESKARTILLETVYFRVQQIQYSNVSLCCVGLTESVHFNRACMSVVDKVNFLLSVSSSFHGLFILFRVLFFVCLFCRERISSRRWARVIWTVFHFRHCRCYTIFMGENIESALYHILMAKLR